MSRTTKQTFNKVALIQRHDGRKKKHTTKSNQSLKQAQESLTNLGLNYKIH